jgi:hypothetical protein
MPRRLASLAIAALAGLALTGTALAITAPTLHPVAGNVHPDSFGLVAVAWDAATFDPVYTQYPRFPVYGYDVDVTSYPTGAPSLATTTHGFADSSETSTSFPVSVGRHYVVRLTAVEGWKILPLFCSPHDWVVCEALTASDTSVQQFDVVAASPIVRR